MPHEAAISSSSLSLSNQKEGELTHPTDPLDEQALLIEPAVLTCLPSIEDSIPAPFCVGEVHLKRSVQLCALRTVNPFSMPPKVQRSITGQKKGPATPVPKPMTWSSPEAVASCSTPPMRNQVAADTPWSSSFDSLVDKANLEDKLDADNLHWHTYIRHLPTRSEFTDILADIK